MKKRNNIIAGIFLFMIPAGVQAQTAESFSLKQAVEYGVANNTTVKTSQLDAEAAKATVKERTSVGLPQVNFNATYNHFITLPTSLIPAEFFGGEPGTFQPVQFGTPENFSASISASQLLFSGPWLYGLHASKVYAELVQKQVEQSESEIRKNVESAYYTVLISKEQEKILQKNIDNISKTLRDVTEMNKQGFVEEIDVNRLQISMSNLLTQLQNTQRQTELAQNLLKFQMGYDITKPVMLTDSLDNLKNNFVLIENDQNYLNRPEFEIIRTTKLLNELNIKVNKSGYYPSLSLFGSYEQTAQRNTFNFLNADEPWFETSLIGIKLDVPIFDGLQKSAQVQNAKIGLQKAELAQQNLNQAVQLEIAQNKTAYLNAQNELNNQQSNIELAQKIYNVSLIKYQQGVGSSLELTSAESSLYQVQGAYIGALYNLLNAETNLKKALGYL